MRENTGKQERSKDYKDVIYNLCFYFGISSLMEKLLCAKLDINIKSHFNIFSHFIVQTTDWFDDSIIIRLYFQVNASFSFLLPLLFERNNQLIKKKSLFLHFMFSCF